MKRMTQRLRALALASGSTLFLLGSCAAAEEFRSVAGDSLHAGVTSIATGLIDGMFAVLEPDGASADAN
jgi:hypothetical protein